MDCMIVGGKIYRSVLDVSGHSSQPAGKILAFSMSSEPAHLPRFFLSGLAAMFHTIFLEGVLKPKIGVVKRLPSPLISREVSYQGGVSSHGLCCLIFNFVTYRLGSLHLIWPTRQSFRSLRLSCSCPADDTAW